jgi:hypothetical protein
MYILLFIILMIIITLIVYSKFQSKVCWGPTPTYTCVSSDEDSECELPSTNYTKDRHAHSHEE